MFQNYMGSLLLKPKFSCDKSIHLPKSQSKRGFIKFNNIFFVLVFYYYSLFFKLDCFLSDTLDDKIC